MALIVSMKAGERVEIGPDVLTLDAFDPVAGTATLRAEPETALRLGAAPVALDDRTGVRVGAALVQVARKRDEWRTDSLRLVFDAPRSVPIRRLPDRAAA